MKKKSGKKVLLIISSSILFILGLLIAAYFIMNPYRGVVNTFNEESLSLDRALTRDEGLADIDYVVKMIKSRHYSAIHGLPEVVKNQYLMEVEELSEAPTTLEVWRASSRIVSKLGDGHSQVYPASKFMQYADVSYKVKDGSTFIDLDGEWFKVNTINNVKVEELYENAKNITSCENEIYMNYLFSRRICIPTYLTSYGSVNNNEYTVEYIKNDQKEKVNFQYVKEQKSIEPKQDFVKYEIDKENDLGIFKLDSCRYNDIYINTLEEFFKEVKENNIKNIAVDLRNNGGGDSGVANKFMSYLKVPSYKDFGSNVRFGLINVKNKSKVIKNVQNKDYLYDGKVYVLTSNQTFSSATMFSVYLQDNGFAKVIGEPSGNSPSAYGDVLTFQLPNSKLMFQTTYKYFKRPDISKDSIKTQIPDYAVPAEDAINELRLIIKKE